MADVNRDGHQDVVLTVSEKHGDVAWFDAPANPAQGTWTRHAIGTGLDSVHSVDVADMDGDGRPDVVLSEFRGAGRLLVFHNERLGLMWTPFTVERGENLHNTRVADLNGDGLPDVFGAAPFGKQPAIAYLSSRAHATRILVFSKTLGFRHDSIPHAVTTLKQMGSANGFTVDATEDSRAFTPSNLDRYRAVVFLNPSGDVLDAAERRSLRRYVEQGHGFVGIHNATALVLEDWRWYTRLVGARYVSEIRTQPLRLVPVDKSGPVHAVDARSVARDGGGLQLRHQSEETGRYRARQPRRELFEGRNDGRRPPVLVASCLRRGQILVHERRRKQG